MKVDLLSHGGNNAVVHMPGRRFPGVLAQGDTLASLLAWAEQTERLLQAGQQAEALEEVDGLADKLGTMLHAYEAALDGCGLPLPYAEPEGRQGRRPGAG